MIFAKKLCFEDMPYQPAAGEVIIEYDSRSWSGTHIKDGILYQRGRYKVELSAGWPAMWDITTWYPMGITIITEMTEPFYIDAYIGGAGSTSTTLPGMAALNPYSGAGKANAAQEAAGGSDGIFGGAAGSGCDIGIAWAIGGGNAVGNSSRRNIGTWDCTGSAGSACWFVTKGKSVGDMAGSGIPDAYRCFHCGGHGGYSAAKGSAGNTYIWGGGGGAYGGGAGGKGYQSDSTVGGSGAGGGGGNIQSDGYGIGAGRANRQGGLAYYDGQNWIDVFNSMQQGDGLGYNTNIPNIRITYLGGSEISDDYIDINVNINSSGYDTESDKGIKYVGFYWSNDSSAGAIEPNILLDVSEEGQYTTTLSLVKKGTVVNVLLWGWFSDAQRANEYTYQRVLCQQFTATEATTTLNINAVLQQLTLGLNTGPISGLANSQDSDVGGLNLFFEKSDNVLANGNVSTGLSLLKTLSIGDTPTEVPSSITVQQHGVAAEKLYLTGIAGPTPPFDTRLQLITEGFQTYLAVEPTSYTVQENVSTYYWTVTYYLQTDNTAGDLSTTPETVDNGLLTDTIETDSIQGALPELGIW